MPIVTIDNAVIADYDQIPPFAWGEKGDIHLPTKPVRFLLFQEGPHQGVGLEVHEHEDSVDAFWEIPEVGFVHPTRFLMAYTRNTQTIHAMTPDCEALVVYIKQYCKQLIHRNCSTVELGVYMPSLDADGIIDDAKIRFKMRPAIKMGDSVYFGCYTNHGSYKQYGPVIRIRSMKEPSIVNALPTYIPDSLIRKNGSPSPLVSQFTSEVRKQCCRFFDDIRSSRPYQKRNRNPKKRSV